MTLNGVKEDVEGLGATLKKWESKHDRTLEGIGEIKNALNGFHKFFMSGKLYDIH